MLSKYSVAILTYYWQFLGVLPTISFYFAATFSFLFLIFSLFFSCCFCSRFCSRICSRTCFRICFSLAFFSYFLRYFSYFNLQFSARSFLSWSPILHSGTPQWRSLDLERLGHDYFFLNTYPWQIRTIASLVSSQHFSCWLKSFVSRP